MEKSKAKRDTDAKTPDPKLRNDADEQSPSEDPERAGEVEGEGSYTASKAYGESVKDFVDSGKVAEASKRARPENEAVARDIERAEGEGRARAKEEDPEVSQPASPPRRR